jgi:UDP-N-acetylmuramoyl-L-alanyl-D-glutamate--2,6-diaminopimelate ligase
MPLAFIQSATPVSLRRLFASASFVGCGDIAVSDVTADSHACRAGSLFAALPGTVADGVDYIDEAIDRGATAVLVERPVTSAHVHQCVVPDVRRAYANICEALYGYPSRRLGIVGVTGTNGKTTVTWLVRAILEAAGWPTALLGTIEYSDGIESEPATLTTPCAKTISRWLATAAARATQYAAIELSSHALDQSRAASTLLDVAIVTNITQDHFDYHGTFGAYRKSKTRILEQLKRRGLVVLNADDPSTADLAALTSNGTQVRTFGLERDANVTAEHIQLTPRGSTFRLRTSVDSVDVRTHLIGRHNVANCLAAAVAAMHVGLPLPEIAEGIEALEFVPGRMERVESDRPFHVYVDYAHTEDALRRAVAAVREVTDGRVLCVFGAGGNRDRSKRPLLGRAAGEADVAVVTSDNPRHEHPHQIIDEILKGCREASVAIHVEPNRAEAIRWAIAQAEPGDAVLVAGKGHETVQIVGEERRPFDDRSVCLAALADLAEARIPAAVS